MFKPNRNDFELPTSLIDFLNCNSLLVSMICLFVNSLVYSSDPYEVYLVVRHCVRCWKTENYILKAMGSYWVI